MRRLTVFGQELAGTLRRASVVDALLRHIREAFGPAEIAVSLDHRDVDVLASVVIGDVVSVDAAVATDGARRAAGKQG